MDKVIVKQAIIATIAATTAAIVAPWLVQIIKEKSRK